jgi:hypothetical protein
MANTETKPVTRVGMSKGEVVSPEGQRPWDDRTLSPQDRYESYLLAAREHVSRIVAASKREPHTKVIRRCMRRSSMGPQYG